jgi:hypothetical protein
MHGSIINDSGITYGRLQCFQMIIIVTFHMERYWLPGMSELCGDDVIIVMGYM